MTPKKEKAVTREELVSLAKEMNEVMGLAPAIKTGSKISDDDLKASIIKNGTGQIYETDFEEDPEDDEKVIFTEEATATLKKLGIAIEVADESGDDASDLDDLDRDGLIEYIKENDLEIKVTKKMDEDAIREAIVAAQSESDDEETTDDEPEEEVVEEKPAKKGKKEEVKEEKKSSKKEAEKPVKEGKKKADVDEDDEKPVKDTKKAPEKTEKAKERDAKNAKMKENLKAKKGDKEKGSSLTMSRYEACAVAFAATPKNKAIDVKKLYAASDAQYVKCGGKSNERENQLVVDRMIDFLAVLEFAKRKEDNATFTF